MSRSAAALAAEWSRLPEPCLLCSAALRHCHLRPARLHSGASAGRCWRHLAHTVRAQRRRPPVAGPHRRFGWVIGEHRVAPRGPSECVLSLAAETPDEVARLVGRAREAGAEIVTEPGPQPWGYTGAFTDPDGHIWMVAVPPQPA